MRDSTEGWAALAMLALGAVAVSCGARPQSASHSRASDERAIRAADIAWSKAADAGDLEQVVSFYTDDVVVLPPNMPAVKGKAAARELNRSLMALPGYSVVWEPEQVEVARSGDIGFARGNYVLTVTGPTGSPMTDKGKYIEIWRKQPDGSWKVVLEALNSDLPSLPPSESPVSR